MEGPTHLPVILDTRVAHTHPKYEDPENGYILPVLDGLDEMGLEQSRAGMAVQKLDEYVRGPMVMTCRTEEYNRMKGGVRPAVRVRIQRLTLEQIREYLKKEATE